jgi:choline dehydrogenase-like flavoprotein
LILDFDNMESGVRLEADICVIGAGVAGLTLAHEFRNDNRKILVIESGGRRDEAATQRLYESDVVGMAHDGIHNGRFRVFGGSSTRWGAQLMTYQSIDFGRRAHVPDSGWPLAYEDVAAYYDRAQAVMRVDNDSFEEDFWEVAGVTPLPVDRTLLQYRFSKWAAFRNRNLARTIGPECEKSSR